MPCHFSQAFPSLTVPRPSIPSHCQLESLQPWFCRKCILWQLLEFGCYLIKKPMSPLWRTPISNYIHPSNITFFGSHMDWRGSKINQGTKPNTHQPFKLHLFKAEPLVSPTCYPIRTWMNPGAIMPRNSSIININQFSSDSVVTFGSPTHRSRCIP